MARDFAFLDAQPLWLACLHPSKPHVTEINLRF